jgi:hypothetical protein
MITELPAAEPAEQRFELPADSVHDQRPPRSRRRRPQAMRENRRNQKHFHLI